MKENKQIIGNLLLSNVVDYLKKLENNKDRFEWLDELSKIFCDECGEQIDYKLPYHKCDE